MAVEAYLETTPLSEKIQAVRDTCTVLHPADPTPDDIVAETVSLRHLSGTLTCTWASTSQDNHTAKGNLPDNLSVDVQTEEMVFDDILDMEDVYSVTKSHANKSSHGDSATEFWKRLQKDHSAKTFIEPQREFKTFSNMDMTDFTDTVSPWKGSNGDCAAENWRSQTTKTFMESHKEFKTINFSGTVSHATKRRHEDSATEYTGRKRLQKDSATKTFMESPKEFKTFSSVDMTEDYQVTESLVYKSSHGYSSKEDRKLLSEECPKKAFVHSPEKFKTCSDMPDVQAFGQTCPLDSNIYDRINMSNQQPSNLLTLCTGRSTGLKLEEKDISQVEKSVGATNFPTLSRSKLPKLLAKYGIQENEVIFFKFPNEDRNATKRNQVPVITVEEVSVLQGKLDVTAQTSSKAEMMAHLQRKEKDDLSEFEPQAVSGGVSRERRALESASQCYSDPNILPEPSKPLNLMNSNYTVSEELKKALNAKVSCNLKLRLNNDRVDNKNRLQPCWRLESPYQISLPNLPEFKK